MDIDDSFGIKASIQIVPEKRYTVSEGFLDSIRARGFEINVHGLDHDGNLFKDREKFLESAKRINEYAVKFVIARLSLSYHVSECRLAARSEFLVRHVDPQRGPFGTPVWRLLHGNALLPARRHA